MTATLTVLFDSDGDGTPETDITSYIVSGPNSGSLTWNRGKSTTSQDYVAGTCTMLILDPDGDFSPENPNGALRTTIKSHTASGDSDQVVNATTQQNLAQLFELSASNEVDKIELYLKWTGSAPAGSAYVEIWHTTSNAPGSLFESMAVSRTLTAAEIGTSYGWAAFTFEVAQMLAADTAYAIVLKTSGYTYSAGVSELAWASNGGTGFKTGHSSTYNGTAWSWLNNGISNPSFETNTTGWTGINSTTLTRITTDSYDGDACLQVDPPGSVGTEGALFGSGAVSASASTAYTFRVAIKGTDGLAYRLAWDENTGGGAYLRTQTSAAQTISGSDWNWFELSASTGASTATVNLYVYHNAVNATRFYLDKAQFSADSAPQGDFKFRVSRNDIRDGRMVWIKVTESATDYPAWAGVLRSVTVHPDRTQMTSYLVCTDFNDDAANKQATLATRASYKYEDCINELWTAAGGLGLSATQVSIGEEENGLHFWYQEPHANIADISDKLADAVAGSVYWRAVSAANGYKRAVFRSVLADATESYAVTEDWGTDYDEKEFDYRWDSREALIINKAIVRSNPRKEGVAATVVGTYSLPTAGEPWGASESRTIWVDFTDPVVRDSTISPVSGTDITAGFTVTSFTEYSHKAKVVITAGGSGGTLLKLQVRGQPYESLDQVTAIAEDSISQSIYGVREHFVDNIYIQRFGRADSLAQTLVNRHRRAYTQPVVKRIGGSTDNWGSLAARDIGDRVTLQLPTRINGGYDADYYIDGLESTISIATTSNVIGQWDIKYRLRKAIEAGQYARVDGDPGIDQGLIAP